MCIPPHDARIEHREAKPGLGEIHPSSTRHFESGLLPRSIPMRGSLDGSERNSKGRTASPDPRRELGAKQRPILLPVDEQLHIESIRTGIEYVTHHQSTGPTDRMFEFDRTAKRS